MSLTPKEDHPTIAERVALSKLFGSPDADIAFAIVDEGDLYIWSCSGTLKVISMATYPLRDIPPGRQQAFIIDDYGERILWPEFNIEIFSPFEKSIKK